MSKFLNNIFEQIRVFVFGAKKRKDSDTSTPSDSIPEEGRLPASVEDIKPTNTPPDNVTTNSRDTTLIYKKSGVLYNPFLWVGRMIIWTNGAIILLVLINAVIWTGFYLQNSREYQVVDLKKPLIVSAYESLDSEQNIGEIEIMRQTCLTLYALHNYSYAAPQKFDLITGLVSPDIISNAEIAYNTNFEKMRESAMVHTICVTDFPLISRQSKNGRITVIVKGYLIVFTQSGNTAGIPARTIPYRAEMGFLVRPATHLTGRHTLYLASITEVAGTSEVSMFDETLSYKIQLLKQ